MRARVVDTSTAPGGGHSDVGGRGTVRAQELGHNNGHTGAGTVWARGAGRGVVGLPA